MERERVWSHDARRNNDQSPSGAVVALHDSDGFRGQMLRIVDDLGRGRRLADKELVPKLGEFNHRSQEPSKRKVLRLAIRPVEVMDRDFANGETAGLDLLHHFYTNGPAIDLKDLYRRCCGA